MKKKLIGLLTLLGLMFAGQASADLISALHGYVGPLWFDLSGYSKSIEAGDPPGTETWGVMTVNGVFKDQSMTVGNRLWVSSPTDQIYGTFYGLTDNYNAPFGTGFHVGLQGGGYTLYAVNHDVNLLQGPGGRIGGFGSDQYTGMGSNVLFKGVFDLGVDPTHAGVTLLQTLVLVSSPTSGTGIGYGSVLSGPLYNQLDSDSILDSSGGKHDLLLSFNVLLPTDAARRAGWSQSLTDPIEANAVPEPATMLLFGAGLIGVASIRRRLSK